jgi:hypothetical protein
MADVLYGGNSSYTTHGNIGSFADTNSPGSSGSTLDTGDLRRKFNFGDRVSELALAQDPFFRFVSMVAKKPTDDPQFKFTEKRGSYHKRYAYVTNHGTTAQTALAGTDATVTHGNVDAGDTYYFTMATDYDSRGNVQNVFGQSSGEISVGDANTQPQFYFPGQVIKIPYMSASATDYSASFDDSSSSVASKPDSYLIAKITSVDTSTTSTVAILKTEIVSKGNAGADFELSSYSAYNNALDGLDISGKSVADYLEPKRSYVVGSTFDKGTGYPETWKDQPYSTGYGQTQIWKTSMAMDNTDRATVLKYEGNEWARIWKEKLVEHKWDIEQSLLFGSQSDNYRTTQGAVDWILNNGNIFSLNTATKTQDDFLDDMSNLLDPRYNNSTATVFFCSTDVYNWLHKLSGYFNNNLSIGSNFRSDMTATGKKNVMGLGVTTISTVYGDMNVVRNIHLDGTHIKMLGINMKYCAYRPLVGNGINRDTSVYVGVQTLENSGVDRRVDQILTEAGMEWSMPECHAIWKS